ncbi:MAG: hypothetical protein ACNA7U_03000 [Candidatus Izemoplasmataceae bacterium]|jgi:hypothetical protein
MIKQYKEFFLSQDLIDVTPYAQSIIDDDVEGFVRTFEPFKDTEVMIDPIEICAAYNSEAIFNYLIHAYDYSEFFNPFRLSLPVILIIFERENLLFDALEHIPFNQQQFLIMYEYMLQTKEADYFIQFYKAYDLEAKYRVDLLKSSLESPIAFEYLIKQKGFKKHLKHEDVIYEIICYHQEFLHYIEQIEDLSKDFDIEDFVPIFKIDDQDDFNQALSFIISRHLDMNAHNEFGLTFFHEGLRHAVKPSYLYTLFEKGANPFFKTSRGYCSSHQLLFRDSEFTLELSRIVDFDAQDLFGLSLKDYDALQRKSQLQLLDILLVAKCVLNMDESAIYELDHAEFYDLSSIHGVDPFINAYAVLTFENTMIKDRFSEQFNNQFQLEDIEILKHSLQESFIYDEDNSVELMDDLLLIEPNEFDQISEFAKLYNTTIKVQTDHVELNKMAHIEIIFSNDGSISRSAMVHTNYIDVYYIHKYYQVPLENITYQPKVSKHQRFLN